jgi:hypothetical protein
MTIRTTTVDLLTIASIAFFVVYLVASLVA